VGGNGDERREAPRVILRKRERSDPRPKDRSRATAVHFRAKWKWSGATLRYAGSHSPRWRIVSTSSRTGTKVLYVGVTGNLPVRVIEHKAHGIGGFTQRYNVDRLVYLEEYSDAIVAIEREKRLKRMARSKKIRLIDSENPERRDLADEL